MALAAVTLFAADALRRQRLGAEISAVRRYGSGPIHAIGQFSLAAPTRQSAAPGGSPYDQTAEVAGVEVRILKTISRTAGGAGTLTSPIVQVFTLVH